MNGWVNGASKDRIPGVVPGRSGRTEAYMINTPPLLMMVTDALKFSGPAPELINGRLAMVGFIFGGSIQWD